MLSGTIADMGCCSGQRENFRYRDGLMNEMALLRECFGKRVWGFGREQDKGY